MLHLLQSWDDPNPSLLNQREPGAQQQRYVTLANDRPVRLHGMKVMIIKYVQNILRQSTTACSGTWYEYIDVIDTGTWGIRIFPRRNEKISGIEVKLDSLHKRGQ